MAEWEVESVFVIYYGLAAHKAAYGRVVQGSRTYTKDYFQLNQSAELREALLAMFPPPAEGYSAITYRWQGGQAPGYVAIRSSDRPHLGWSTSDGPPAPLKMTPQPNSAGPQTIPGDPTKTAEADANAEFDALTATGMSAYIVAVKLVDEPAVLHLRVYLRNPIAGLEFADVAQLPDPIRRLALSTKQSDAFQWLPLGNEGQSLSPEVAELMAKLEENPNLLLVGPPGTGKTVLLDKLAKYIENPGSRVLFDPDKNHDAWSIEQATVSAGKVRTVVFHPNYSYDNLVVGLLPSPNEAGGVAVQAVAGPLLNLAYYATRNPQSRTVLILDEFNRGNAASILGDMLALMDKDKRASAAVDLAYADLGISVAPEFTDGGQAQVPSRFTLPPNLWLVAAMNSSDRSVAPLDAALRRRFSIREIPPDYAALELHLDAANTMPASDRSGSDPESPTDLLAQWTSEEVARLAVEVLKAINRRITTVLGSDFELGQSNFWHVEGTSAQKRLDALVTAWDDRIKPTLRMAFQDNDEALAAVLLAGATDTAMNKTDDNSVPRAAWWRAADIAVPTYGQPRLVLTQLGSLDPSEALTELLRQANR